MQPSKHFHQITFLLALLAALPIVVHPQQNIKEKYENVLAVFIYNITKFIQFPEVKSDNFYISVLGKSDVVAPLELIAKNEKINGKNIIVKEIDDISELRNTDILFLSSGSENILKTALGRIRGKEIILIAHSKGFAEKGAGVNFILEGDRIKFEINKNALEGNGFVPNSRLLSLAVRVYD